MRLIASLFFCLLCTANLNAQHTLVGTQDTLNNSYHPLTNTALNILYKDYDNKVVYSAPDLFDTIVVESNVPASINVYDLNILSIYFGHPGRNKVTLKVWGLNKNDSTLISTNRFHLLNLPEPNVLLHNALISGDGGAFTNEPLERLFSFKKIYSMSSKYVDLEDDFRVVEWTITVGNDEFQGSGNEVSEEVCEAIYNSPKGTIVKINHVKVKSTYKEFEIDIPLEMHKTSDIHTFRPTEFTPIICE